MWEVVGGRLAFWGRMSAEEAESAEENWELAIVEGAD